MRKQRCGQLLALRRAVQLAHVMHAVRLFPVLAEGLQGLHTVASLLSL